MSTQAILYNILPQLQSLSISTIWDPLHLTRNLRAPLLENNKWHNLIKINRNTTETVSWYHTSGTIPRRWWNWTKLNKWQLPNLKHRRIKLLKSASLKRRRRPQEEGPTSTEGEWRKNRFQLKVSILGATCLRWRRVPSQDTWHKHLGLRSSRWTRTLRQTAQSLKSTSNHYRVWNRRQELVARTRRLKYIQLP